MEKRLDLVSSIHSALKSVPVVALLGPRQSGKTTLARMIAKGHRVHFFDLEDPTDLSRLDSPKLALQDLEGLVVIDEIQRRPELFPVLRVLVDRPKSKTRFLILGSASQHLIRQSTETLAGRIRYIEISPFSIFEIKDSETLWERGGFPRSYLAKTKKESWSWRQSYVQTFLEKDIPQLGITIPALTLRKFWMMLAHYHGNIFNASEIGRSLQITNKQIQRYLDILSGTFMMRQLPPWHENLDKRQVKSPKIYFRDSGIFHYLSGITDLKALHSHPKLGASWEGFALENVIRKRLTDSENFYFWATHSQAELDLLWVRGNERIGFEFKHTDSPKITKSMLIAMQDLKLSKLFIVIPGRHDFLLKNKIRVVGLEDLNF